MYMFANFLQIIIRHRAINLYLKAYRDQWLHKENPGHETLIADITVSKHKS